MKKIILCADDYGQNQSISQAIITLLERKRLSATSCMTTAPLWPEHAKWLQSFKNQVDIGLHFNLTEGHLLSDALKKSHGFMPLGQMIKRAYCRMLNASAIEAELHAQLDRFEAAMDQLPDFIDGHQHVHQLPVIRHVLLNVYEKRLRERGSYIRCVYDPKIFSRLGHRYFVKKLMIQWLTGAASFKQELIQRKVPHNSSFAGIYPFAASAHYSTIFPEFLSQMTHQGIIMCHPGLPSQDDSDPIAKARHHEFLYFESEQFIADCHRVDIVTGQFYNA